MSKLSGAHQGQFGLHHSAKYSQGQEQGAAGGHSTLEVTPRWSSPQPNVGASFLAGFSAA